MRRRQAGFRGFVERMALLCLCGIELSAVQDRPQQPEALPEYVLKAGFLYNFAKYVEWPAEAFERPESPITIGVVGKDPFGGDLEDALKNKTVKNRAFAILRFPKPSDIQRCHILFVARSEKERVPRILERIRDWPVLTVGEEEEFARAGGALNILIENDKPKLEANPQAAEKARLKIDAKLLKAATLVKTE
ncbi:MAG: YfiR family protein [Planctomycetes bacterium]|nr:YfiR family protein [Planctomycetota bacterium]